MSFAFSNILELIMINSANIINTSGLQILITVPSVKNNVC